MNDSSIRTKNINGTKIEYKFRPAAQDRRHLIVIFSGFRNINTFDFDGASASSLKANILWIKDKFDNNFSYYLRLAQSDRIESTVYELIEQTRKALGLEKDNVSLAGFSKGGSAALFFGLKYNYGAILSVVPQFHIGQYVAKNWPEIYRHMTGSDSASGVHELDQLIPNLVDSDKTTKRNIYLFSSLADPQHDSQVAPYLERLKKYSNFNYIETDSPLVTAHNIVTRYNIPLIASILGALGENATPHFGMIKNGSRAHDLNLGTIPIDRQIEIYPEPIGELTSLAVKDGNFYPQGYAFLKGNEAPTHKSIQVGLFLSTKDSQVHLPIGTAKDMTLSYKFFDRKYCDYTYAGFSSIGSKGINLDAIPHGINKINFKITHNGLTESFPAAGAKNISAWYTRDTDLVHVEADGTSAHITKRSPIGFQSADTVFTVDTAEVRNSRMFLQGHFIQPGFATPNYKDVNYYAVLCDANSINVQYTIPLASDKIGDYDDKAPDQWIDYSKSYFATHKYLGFDVSRFNPGEYDLYITARYGDKIFSKKTILNITVESDEDSTRLPSIAVHGSCVSRDMFNSKLVPKWKQLYKLAGENYQCSLVSLMSQPVLFSDDDFSDMDSHSRRITENDFSKSFVSNLVAEAPDAILIDFLADAKYGVLSVDSSYVTFNKWKLAESNYVRTLGSIDTVSLETAPDEYINLFRDACLRFKALQLEYFPETKIFINQARSVTSYPDESKVTTFSRRGVSLLNGGMSTLESIFHEIVGGQFVNGMSDGLQSDRTHPWGPGPVHYQKRYYRKLEDSLVKGLGRYHPKVTFSQRNPS